jgi:acetylornithine deacetylase/succinyl-diaminopimelate desuccinylase-like protein
MLEHGRELIAGAEYLINEGGENLVDENGEVPYWGVDVAEKIPFWLRLRARGEAGHGSVPDRNASTHRLVRALARVADYETPVRVLPSVQQVLCDEGRLRFPEEKEKLCNLEESLRDPAYRKRVTDNEDWNYLLRNTISITVLQGGPQTNVIPGEATAELDVRLLPEEDPKKFLAEMRRVIADDAVEIEVMSPYRVANSSPTDNELWRAFEWAVARHYPKAILSPRLTSGYTENQMYRTLGIASYGFCPFVTTETESHTPHGDDERILVEEYKQGLRILWDVVTRVAASAPQH